VRIDSPLHHPQGVLGFAHHRKRSPLVFAAKLLVIVIVIAIVAFTISATLPQGPRDAAAVAVELPNETDAAVAVLLRGGVLRRPTTFRVLVAARRQPIRVGRYTISPHLSAWSLARLVTTTQPRPEREIRIIEGWNLRDIGQYLEREGIAQAEELHELAGFPAMDYRSADLAIPRPKDFSAAFTFLKEDGKPDFIGLDGYLFPDTYRVYEDASVEDIVRKMLENFSRKLTPELRDEIVKSGRSLHQIITMASLIEAEIANHEDRATAAGILWKRRDRGMFLQVDATVNYVTGKRDPRVSRDDAAYDSAYNTYKYPGLPRGPIGNPGMSAILAALRPKESSYWFFLTTKEGKTVFSRTLEEHNANVQRHLQ
jgi:UPF0755 protein